MPAFDAAAAILQSAIATHAFPGASVDVGRADGSIWSTPFGRHRYAADGLPVTPETIFDLASLTKVVATTTLVMQAVERGRLSLDERVANRIPEWRGPDREMVTIADLLEHASGLTAYLPFFRDHEGRVDFERAIATLPLEYAPRTQSIYSDLGFMLLGFILEDVNGAPLATHFDRVWRSVHVKGEGTGAYERLAFNPPRDWRDRTAPTELDLWRGRLLQGEVHDENAWALGGAAGHAGLFGTAAAVGAFARAVLHGLTSRGTSFARPDTFARFVRKSTVPGSSRALGWDTMLPSSSCGASLSTRAIGHTGFTGTSLWIDPEHDLYIVLLTNRVHPTRDNTAIQSVRRKFHEAVAAACGIDPAASGARAS